MVPANVAQWQVNIEKNFTTSASSNVAALAGAWRGCCLQFRIIRNTNTTL